MKAIIMAGGKGTRLRPLTCKHPKPMVPIATRPMMEYIIRLLHQYNLVDIGVTLFYLPEIIRNYFGQGKDYGVSLRYFIEEIPLGTAGSVKNAEEFLDETFLVISGDALTDINLDEAIDFHRKKNALATLVLTRVNNPLEYGVVITDENGHIRRFLEKPGWGEVFSDTVNTGIYILEPEIFQYYEKDRNVDFSKDLFPKLLSAGAPLYGYVADGYWSDVGTLEQYRQANYDLLKGELKFKPPGQEIMPGVWAGEGAEIDHRAIINPPVVLGEYAKIKKGAYIGEFSVVGDYSLIQEDSSLKRSILWNHTYVGTSSEVRGAILSAYCHVKPRVSIYEGVILGDGCTVGSRSQIRPGIKVWPDKYIESGSILNNSLIWGNRWGNNLFGNLGVDKTANIELTPEFTAKLGAAYGTILPENGQVVVSTDTFRPARMLKRAIISGLLGAGINVFDLGTLTTSITRFAINKMEADAGLHLRLSPSNKENVLIEFLDEKGLNLDRGKQRKIEQAFFTEEFRRVEADKVGELAYVPRLIQEYLESVISSLDSQVIKDAGFKVAAAYDTGTVSLLLPRLLEHLGCKVKYAKTLDYKKGPKTREELQESIETVAGQIDKEDADLGIVVDSNAERLILIDETGRIVQDEHLNALISLLVLKYSKSNTITVPVTAGRAIEKLAEDYNGNVVRTKANPRSVMESTARESLFPAGDGKTQFQPAFDAIFSLAKILELMAREKMSLSQIVSLFPSYYRGEKDVDCSWEDKGRIMRSLFEENKGLNVEVIDGLKVYHDDGWALVLPDAEDPVFRVYTEASSQEAADALTELYTERIYELQQQ